ncbi:MAG: pitrilysin family protein [Myxococcales bacterium]|nr:insulinase family protein [Myxococcota bacterium]MDW8282533.1 pitrilysin family protein [Myxococcales bacterium]
MRSPSPYATLALAMVCACAEPQVRLSALPPPIEAGVPRTAASVQDDRYQLPPLGPPPRFSPPQPQRFELSNGMHVWVVQRPLLPIVVLSVVWAVGALEDPPDRPGMASLCADMLDEGAGRRGPLELAGALAHLGATLSIHTSFSATVVQLRTLSQNLLPSVRLLADVLRRPRILPAELKRVKADTITRIRQRQDAPQNIAHDLLEAALYGPEHRRRAPAIGTAEAVALLDHYDCRWWHRERLRPDDAAIFVVGDVEPAAVRALLGDELGGWKASKRRKELPRMAPVPVAQRRILAVDLPGQSQTVILVGEPSVPRNHPDYFPLLVLNTLLGGQFNSRLMMNLREQHGYTYGASSEFSFARDGGPFLMRASVRGDSTREALAEMLREAAAIRSAKVAEAELQQARDYLTRSLAGRFASAVQVAGELSALHIHSLPENFFATFAERVAAVDAAEVHRVAVRYLDPTRMTIVLVGDRRHIERAADLGPIEYRSPPGG